MDPIRPSTLWKQLSPERRLAAALAFWHDEHSVAEQAEVIGQIARQIKFRPRSVLAMPVEARARHLVRLGTISDSVAGRLLVAYHLSTQRPMMASFLDALGIPHERGLITAEEFAVPERQALLAAARSLSETYPAEDVALYLSTLATQDERHWGALREM